MFCKLVKPLWFFVKSLLRSLCNHRLKLEPASILFCQLAGGQRPGADKFIILYIVSSAKFSIWCIRNQKKDEHLRVDEGSCLKLFQKRLKYRILADFMRWDELKLSEYWGRGDLICNIGESGQLEFKF